MKRKSLYTFVISQVAVAILSIISICKAQGHRSGIRFSNLSTPAFLNSNQETNNYDGWNNDLERRNYTYTYYKLDKVFGVDSRIFEEYLKDEDLTIIPGQRKDDDFENWTPPKELQRDIPVYMSGFDYNDRPIWVLEWGRWRFDKYATRGQKRMDLFEKYMRYLTYTALKSHALRSTKENRVTEHISLFDYEGLNPEFLTNRQIIQLQLKVISNYRRYYEKYVCKAIWINVNPVSEILLNLFRPFFIRLLSKIEIYGTNKYIWGPQLLKSFPKDQIPEWYGGNRGFEPLHRFG